MVRGECLNKLIITRATVTHSYRENLAVPSLLTTLAESRSNDNVVIVADDSKPEKGARIVSGCERAMLNSPKTLIFSLTESKAGRGAAVRKGVKLVREEYPNLVSIMECDSDRSHQPQDIFRLRDSSIGYDLLMGHRYLKKSQIVGWLIRCRNFSRILNVSTPVLLQLFVKDITNGLRKCAIRAADLILSNKANNSGFIYLSEQALLISRRGFEVQEIPSVFTDRELGSSTVIWQEIVDSILGIIKLVSLELGSRFTSK